MKKLLLIIAILSIWAFRSTDDRPTVFLCGDSTMANKAPIDAPETGWGMAFPEYFMEAIRIENHALNGRLKRW